VVAAVWVLDLGGALLWPRASGGQRDGATALPWRVNKETGEQGVQDNCADQGQQGSGIRALHFDRDRGGVQMPPRCNTLPREEHAGLAEK